MCEPDRCPNACISDRHRGPWERGVEEAKTLLREKRLPEPQRVALQAEVTRIAAILDDISAETTAELGAKDKG